MFGEASFSQVAFSEPVEEAAAAGGGVTNTNLVGSAGRIAGNYGGLAG